MERLRPLEYRKGRGSRTTLTVRKQSRVRCAKLTLGDTDNSSLSRTVRQDTGVRVGGGRSKVDDDSSLLVGGPEWSVLVGAVWVVVWLVDGVRDMSVDNECSGDVDVQHLGMSTWSPCILSYGFRTHLLEVGNRLGHIVGPLPLDGHTRAVHTSLQVAVRLDNILHCRLDGVRIGDVDSIVLRLVGRHLLSECLALGRVDHVEQGDRRALGCEELGGCSTDPTGTAGDDLAVS